MFVRYLEKIDVVPQTLFFQQQGEDQGELLRQAIRKHLTVERNDGVRLQNHTITSIGHQKFGDNFVSTELRANSLFVLNRLILALPSNSFFHSNCCKLEHVLCWTRLDKIYRMLVKSHSIKLIWFGL